MANIVRNKEFSEEAEAAVSVLRALVASKKGPSTVQSILADFRELEGGPLMYKRFGFPSADEFLRCTGEFVLQNRMGETVIYVKPSKESAHILKMVAAQKPSKTKKSGFAVLRQPQKNYTGSNWSPSAYNKMYPIMPYQLKKYPQHRYLPTQQSRYNNTNSPLKQIHQNGPGGMKYGNNRNYGPTQNTYSYNQPKFPSQQQNVALSNKRDNQTEANNNNTTAKNLNKPGQAPFNNLKIRLTQNEQPKQTSDGFSKQSRDAGDITPTKNIFLDSIDRIVSAEVNQKYTSPPVPNLLYPSPVRSVNTRLQVTNISSPTSVPVLEPTFQPKQIGTNNIVPRQEFISIQPVLLMPPSPPPVIQLPTLPGQKTLQDRLKMNQQVDSADLEKVAKVITPQSSPIKVSDSIVKVPSTPPVAAFRNQSVLHEVNLGATPVELLAALAQSNGFLPPVYNYYKLKNKRFQCRVTINKSTYSCYPHDYANEFEAQFAAAQIAIENIKRDEERNSYSVCLDSDYEIALKIFDLLVTCTHGMFSKNIPDVFRTQYKCLLPDHWESIILSHTRMFSREETARSTIIFANVRENAPPEESSIANTSEATRMKANLLALPWKEKYWNIYVTNPVSTVEIWARLVGPEHSDAFDTLVTDIELYMMDEKPKPKNIIVGEYYLVCPDDCWFRVRAEELDSGENICLCFFIDIGDWERVSLDDLYACKAEYLELPAQSICFTLHGLEDFGEHPKSKPHLNNLICGKVCIGEILTTQEDYEKCEESAAGDARIQTILFDTSSEEDINLSFVILKQMCDDMPVPELDRKNINSVIITHVDEVGDEYCQLKDGGMVYIQKLITNLVLSNALEAKHRGLSKTKTATGQQLYLVQNEADKKWYRASFIAETSSSLCKMLFVDTGLKENVAINNIYRLETLSVALNRYPAQAIQMRMFNMEEMNDYLLCRLRALLKPGLTAMVKVAACSSVPLVKIYIHAEPNNILVCINDSIRTELELEMTSELISNPRIVYNETTSSSAGSSSKLNTSFTSDYSIASQEAADISKSFHNLRLTSSPVPSQVTPKLPKFQLPAVGQRFDVNVTIASSPNYFIVQPYMQAIDLQRMMVELQKYCLSEAKRVSEDSIEKGEAYAGLNSDDSLWYRVLIVNILDGPTSIHVYFCDFGQIRIVNSDSLRILPQHLRKLPQQAVKAKLYGVQPLHTDWSTGDAVRFQTLTVEKKFAGQVRSIHVDEINPSDDIVELTLIDVSTDEDTFIHQVLVNEKRAIFIGK
ncbi:tudor domain-containing protein 7B [Wyeomyia smithii]|uniref:tudor domain-containing protein 7B n=1 Tax=Wyeomyia smithii TaxID=174621 RepID=UPI0024681F92|nr:tudor domain-containing protein 7B [Wyeomyia smithii]XP_055535045.1 tudor domain-containing protein 7B [Wyeomyia smithii]